MTCAIKKIEKNNYLIEINKEIYDKKAIESTCYKFTDKCFVQFNLLPKGIFNVYFQLKDINKGDLETIVSEFCNELIDQQLRLDLESTYGNIRELIVRQAFNPIDNIKDKIHN